MPSVPRYVGAAGDTVGSGGVRLTLLVAEGPGERAGLQAGDVVLRLGDANVRDWETFLALLAGYEAGDTVSFAVLRGDETTSILVELGRRGEDLR